MVKDIYIHQNILHQIFEESVSVKIPRQNFVLCGTCITPENNIP